MGESPSLRVRAHHCVEREPNQCLRARTPFSSTTLQPVQLRDSEARHVLSVEATAAPPREQTVQRQPFWRLKGEVSTKKFGAPHFGAKTHRHWVYMLGHPAACLPT